MIDLNAPLGKDLPRRRRRRPLLLAASCAAVVSAVLIGLLAVADPHGGEPYAVAAIPPPLDPAPTASLPPLPPPVPVPPAEALKQAVAPAASEALPPGLPGAPGAAYDAGTLENGVKVYRGTAPTAASPKGPLVIDVSRQLGLPPRGDAAKPPRGAGSPGFTGPAGVSDSSGFTPFAPPGPLAAAATTASPAGPRIAIFIGNMGLSQPATRQAIETMPAAVTLAFLPYGDTLRANLAAARGKGHEVLLQVPMENAGAPPPGPRALRAGESAEALAADLDWLLGRFSGYDGLSNLLGAPVTADPAAMAALAKAAAARRLFLATDGSGGATTLEAAAARTGVPAVAADVLLDATADPAAVRGNLARLVEIARRKGSAIGVASGLPEHMALIAHALAELPAKNIALVPVGTLARRSATVATIAR